MKSLLCILALGIAPLALCAPDYPPKVRVIPAPPSDADTATLLNGRIVGFQLSRPGEAPFSHLFADVQLPSGNTYIVDLGSTSEMRGDPMRVGDVISISAHPGTADGVAIMIADRFQYGRTARP